MNPNRNEEPYFSSAWTRNQAISQWLVKLAFMQLLRTANAKGVPAWTLPDEDWMYYDFAVELRNRLF